MGLVDQVQAVRRSPRGDEEVDPIFQAFIRANRSKFPAKRLLQKPSLSPLSSSLADGAVYSQTL